MATARITQKSLLSTTLAAVLLLSSLSSLAYPVFAAPFISDNDASTSTASINEDMPSSPNIVRSIGFRDCSSDSATSNIRLSRLTLLYDAESNTISVRAEGSTAADFEVNSGIFIARQKTTEKSDQSSVPRKRATDACLLLDNVYASSLAHVLLTAYDRTFYDGSIDLAKVAPFIPR